MTCYPEVLKRAQEEIDRVVGTDRLPSFSDRSKLPYVEALLKETLRWENVVPVSMYNYSFITHKYVSSFTKAYTDLPHSVIDEDTYMDYRIPKGSIILANIW